VRFSKNPQTFRDKLFVAEGQTERGTGMMSLKLHFLILERRYKRDTDLQIHSFTCANCISLQLSGAYSIPLCYMYLSCHPFPTTRFSSSVTSFWHLFLGLPPNLVLPKFIHVDWLISNAHSEIFCQRSTVTMRSQCVFVATTLLHSDANFHSFLYNGSKTARVNMESCYGGMSTRLKQRAVTEF